MMKRLSLSLAATVFVSIWAAGAMAGGPPGGTIWADGLMFRTVAAPNDLPPFGPKDGIFVFEGLTGQNAVAEAKPGDQDYNGGRWQVYVLAFTPQGVAVHDPDGNGVVNFELTSWEMVNHHISLGHLVQAGMGPSFVCPLIK